MHLANVADVARARVMSDECNSTRPFRRLDQAESSADYRSQTVGADDEIS
jgi:hypothetical protein